MPHASLAQRLCNLESLCVIGNCPLHTALHPKRRLRGNSAEHGDGTMPFRLSAVRIDDSCGATSIMLFVFPTCFLFAKPLGVE